MEYVIIIPVAFGAALLTFFSGFGLGTILMPVFALFFPVEIAIAVTAIVHLANNLFKGSLVWKHIHKKVVAWFAIPAAGAAFAGAYLLNRLSGQADLITYPSLYEGFGNALLEAFYYRKPVLVNRYAIFIADIEPKGFEVITMNGFLTRHVLDQVRRVISDDEYRTQMVDQNLELGKKFFSYSVLRRKLRSLITSFTGLDDL